MTDDDHNPPADHRPHGLRRRQVIAAGAWAAPVILLATAAPAYAAVSQTFTGDVLRVFDFVAGPHNASDPATPPGVAGTFRLAYDPTEWNDPASSVPPESATATWTVLISGPTSGSGPSVTRTVTGTTVVAGSPTTGVVVPWFIDSDDTLGVLEPGSTYSVTLTVDGTTGSPQYVPDDPAAVSGSATVEKLVSTPGADANVPADYLQVQAYSISNLNAGGTNRGPLQWNGAQIGYWSHSVPAEAHFEVVITIDGPGSEYDVTLDGEDVALRTGGALTAGSTQIGPSTGNMPPGLYTATLTVYGTDGTTNSSSATYTIE